MALKRKISELCERCGAVHAKQNPDGSVAEVFHRCANPVPGPQAVPFYFRPGEAIFEPAKKEGSK
jgi:hypothetical protein